MGIRRQNVIYMEEKLKSHFLSLYCMVVVDQDVSACELEELYRIGKEHYGLKDDEINRVITSQGSAFYNPDKIEDKIRYLYELALMAYADGKIEKEERFLLEKYALMLGFVEENIVSLIEFLLDNAKNKKSLDEVIREVK